MKRSRISLKEDHVNCEYCKKFIPEGQQSPTKRFCSKLCYSRYYYKIKHPMSEKQVNKNRQTRDEFNKELLVLSGRRKE